MTVRASLGGVRLEASAGDDRARHPLLALVKGRLLVRRQRHQEPPVEERRNALERFAERLEPREERQIGLLQICA